MTEFETLPGPIIGRKSTAKQTSKIDRQGEIAMPAILVGEEFERRLLERRPHFREVPGVCTPSDRGNVWAALPDRVGVVERPNGKKLR